MGGRYKLYDGDLMEFGSLKGRDFELNHGEDYHYGESYSMDTDACEYFNGRLENYNHRVLDDFYFSFEEIEWGYEDYEDIVDVYNRKAKDWYVGNRLEIFDTYVHYYERDPKDFEIIGLEQQYIELYIYEDYRPSLDAVMNDLMSIKHDIEIKSYIANELHENYEYQDGIFNKEILKNVYDEDLREAEIEIQDFIDYGQDASAKILVEHAYEKFLERNLDINGKLFGKYTHLLKLIKLAEADGKEVTYSKIAEFTEDCSYALKFKGEEYHFTLGELFNSDPKKFYQNVSQKLSKRLLERYEQSILIQKAKNVFVGLDDSYNSGNCKVGTSSWTSRFGIDTKVIGGIRGDEILKLDFSSFTKRAVMQAIKRSRIN